MPLHPEVGREPKHRGKSPLSGSGKLRRNSMKAILLVSAVLVLIAPPLRAQTRIVAERLGYPRDAKLLILHADDLGAAHSINAASFDALDKGVISSASIMMPTPWVTEVAGYARSHPDADLGLRRTQPQ